MNRWSPFEWITAIRFLKEGRMQTAFIVVAVAIGVAVIVFMSAMLSSMQANFMKRMLTAQAHIQLVPMEETVRPLQGQAAGAATGAVLQQPAQHAQQVTRIAQAVLGGHALGRELVHQPRQHVGQLA